MTNPHPAQLAADRYAMLVAFRDAFGDLATDAREALLADAAHQRSASWDTPRGQVNATRSAAKVVVDPAGLLEMVKAHYPDEVITTEHVRPSFAKAFAAELTDINGTVIHRGTGEVVDFAHVQPAGDLRVSYPASKAQTEAKALARMLLEDSLPALESGLREVTG